MYFKHDQCKRASSPLCSAAATSPSSLHPLPVLPTAPHNRAGAHRKDARGSQRPLQLPTGKSCVTPGWSARLQTAFPAHTVVLSAQTQLTVGSSITSTALAWLRSPFCRSLRRSRALHGKGTRPLGSTSTNTSNDKPCTLPSALTPSVLLQDQSAPTFPSASEQALEKNPSWENIKWEKRQQWTCQRLCMAYGKWCPAICINWYFV